MSLDIGSRLNRYTVDALIGEGGFGRVYRATETKPHRQLALKILFVVLVAAIAIGCAPAVSPTGIAIDNVTVIDAVSGTRENQRVVIDGDLIVSVSGVEQSTAPTADTVDGAGQFLIPGLWDMHAHFVPNKDMADAMPGLFLRYGVTSVRDTGGLLSEITSFRARLDASTDPAPRIFIAGPLLDGKFPVYDGHSPRRPRAGISVLDPASARQRVRALKEAGVDFIKIYELVDPEVFEALSDEARQLGLPIAAHVPLTMTADAVGPKVDSMEHLRNIEVTCAANWQQLLEVRRQRIREFTDGRGSDLRSQLHALQRGPAIDAFDASRCDQVIAALRDTVQVPTLRLNRVTILRMLQRADWRSGLAELPASVQEQWQAQADQIMEEGASEGQVKFAEWQLFLTKRLWEEGVPLAAGTDTPVGQAIPGYSLHTELARLVEAGLSPREALYAATVQPAKFFGLDGEMGQIQAGMRADLLLLEANPLEDIENSRRIAAVMSRGRWVN